MHLHLVAWEVSVKTPSGVIPPVCVKYHRKQQYQKYNLKNNVPGQTYGVCGKVAAFYTLRIPVSWALCIVYRARGFCRFVRLQSTHFRH
jgi:hypothetical protein